VPRALVTGATGLAGSHIVERLLGDGWSVRALVRSPAPELTALGVETVRGDVLDSASFAAAAVGRDVIFHTAAAVTTNGGWEAFRHLNVDGTSNAIVAAERSGARLVHLSSVAVYGPDARYHGANTTNEDTPFGTISPRSFYARSKRESEQLVLGAQRAGRVWATAVRPDVIFGRRDRQFIPRMARLLQRGFAPLVGGGHSTLAMVHAANVADGAVRAASFDGANGRAYNLANDFDVTVRQFFTWGGEGLGRRVRFVSVPLPVARVAFNVIKRALLIATAGRLSAVSNASLHFISSDNPFNSDRARRELGWSPSVRPEHSVPEAFRWWLTNR
jgi:nucleoside-diphosphate-sugar epimerase